MIQVKIGRIVETLISAKNRMLDCKEFTGFDIACMEDACNLISRAYDRLQEVEDVLYDEKEGT